jgi:hypothetical protein
MRLGNSREDPRMSIFENRHLYVQGCRICGKHILSGSQPLRLNFWSHIRRNTTKAAQVS